MVNKHNTRGGNDTRLDWTACGEISTPQIARRLKL